MHIISRLGLPVARWLTARSSPLILAIAVAIAAPALGSEPPQSTYSTSVVARGVMVPMRDGVTLATDIYTPSNDGVNSSPGRFPTLLLRTPYGKADWAARPSTTPVASIATLHPDTANRHGYVIVFQDVRGTHESGGVFEPMLNEGADGHDTLEWIRAQPWSDGRIATFGPSYMGGVQMLLAADQSNGLVTAFSEVAATDQYRNEWVYMDGVFALSTGAAWTFEMAKGAVSRQSPAQQSLLNGDYADLGVADSNAMSGADFDKLFRRLPLLEMPGARRAPWWTHWLDNWSNPAYFENNQMSQRFEQVTIPILHLGGWYDLFLRNTYEHYQGISTQAKDPAARANQRLIIGPWSHGTCDGCEQGSEVDSEAMQLAWMNQWFKEKKHQFFEHPVVLYVMGANRWRSESSWPLAGTKRTRYYLHSEGGANTASGNGTLSVVKPGIEPPDEFLYDPRNPAPTLGGIGLTGSRAVQNDAERRADMLVFTSPVLSDDLEVTGEVNATLYAASSARDTDWWIKLVDVDEDGNAFILNQGVARARFRHSRTKPEPLTPGKIEQYSIDMWATSNVFKKGHRIRLEVTSSNFPYADRNPNAFVDLSKSTERDFVAANQTVYHDRARSSYVELPIIPRSRSRNWIETPFPNAAAP